MLLTGIHPPVNHVSDRCQPCLRPVHVAGERGRLSQYLRGGWDAWGDRDFFTGSLARFSKRAGRRAPQGSRKLDSRCGLSDPPRSLSRRRVLFSEQSRLRLFDCEARCEPNQTVIVAAARLFSLPLTLTIVNVRRSLGKERKTCRETRAECRFVRCRPVGDDLLRNARVRCSAHPDAESLRRSGDRRVSSILWGTGLDIRSPGL